ncbi:MAG: hypothetical protein DMG87_17670 [Acidobacteria bacterium]|nr:MAG: hypothetical protein DMG87_17670 [Acidobacteriota bacterium]
MAQNRGVNPKTFFGELKRRHNRCPQRSNAFAYSQLRIHRLTYIAAASLILNLRIRDSLQASQASKSG